MLWWLYVGAGLGYWLYNLVATIRIVRTVPCLASLTPRSDGHWPRISHVVPACNEADQFTAAVRTRLEEGYPDAEFVLVDDRSTDGTGALADQLAEIRIPGRMTRTGCILPLPDFESIVQREVIDRFDHKHLNEDTPDFAKLNPSVENIASVIWTLLEKQVPPAALSKVRVWETPKTCAEFRG